MTEQLRLDLLAEEIEHEAWFLELLHGRPSGQVPIEPNVACLVHILRQGKMRMLLFLEHRWKPV